MKRRNKNFFFLNYIEKINQSIKIVDFSLVYFCMVKINIMKTKISIDSLNWSVML